MKTRPSPLLQVILAGAIALGAGSAFGQTATTSSVPPPAPVTASGGDLRHAQRAGEQFGTFAGSRENTEALALALRSGSEVILVGADGTPTTFTPATGHMGHGNVTKSMALAQRQLAALGITDPTPQQVEAALNGGVVTVGSGADARTVEMQGILRLRADGMGWGEIAHTVGIKPGQGFKPLSSTSSEGVITPYGHSHRVRAEERVRTGERVGDTAGGELRSRSELRTRSETRGVVTAAGGAHVSGTEIRSHKGGGAEIAHRQAGRALGSGIVTAAGAPAVGGQAARGDTRIQRGGGAESVHSGGGRPVASGGGVVSAAGNTSVAMNASPRPGGGNGGGVGHGKR